MHNLPSGMLTFLFTDIEGSTVLWEQHPEQARTAMKRHDEIVEDVVGRHNGMLVRPRGEGDSRFAVFARATDAVSGAAALQNALHTEPWRHLRHYACAWLCTREKPIFVTATTMVASSTAVRGFARQRMVDRLSSPA